MAALTAAYPNVVRKETLLEPSDLKMIAEPFISNGSSRLLSISRKRCVCSNVRWKHGESCRRPSQILRFWKTIVLNQKLIVELVDRYSNGTLGWDEFSSSIKAAHADRMGMPSRRVAVPDRPKEEDYFYANP